MVIPHPERSLDCAERTSLDKVAAKSAKEVVVPPKGKVPLDQHQDRRFYLSSMINNIDIIDNSLKLF